MISSMQRAVIEKDIKIVVSNKRVFPVLLIVPLILTVILPSVFILTVYFIPDGLEDFMPMLEMLPEVLLTGDVRQDVINLIVSRILPNFFLLIPIMAATVMAASSFAGEKEKRTLETLLCCPLSIKQIFQAKILASFVMSMIVSFSSFAVMTAAVQTEVYLISGSFVPYGVSWLVTMLLFSPAVSLAAVSLIVQSSAKAKTADEAQQRAVFLIIPVIALIAGQFTGLISAGTVFYAVLGVLSALAALALLNRSFRKFTYENLLQ